MNNETQNEIKNAIERSQKYNESVEITVHDVTMQDIAKMTDAMNWTDTGVDGVYDIWGGDETDGTDWRLGVTIK